MLTTLGGHVIDGSPFDPSAFALIANALARSEKVLCSIAAGKPLLSSAYLTASIEAGRFLPVRPQGPNLRNSTNYKTEFPPLSGRLLKSSCGTRRCAGSRLK